MAGFNAYPAMSIRSPDLSQVLATASALKTANLKNRLLERKMATEAEKAALRKQVLSPGGQASPYSALAQGGGPTNEAAALMDKSASFDPDSAAMRQLLAIDPAEGKQIIDAIGSMNKAQRDAAKEKNSTIARLLMSVEDAPEAQRPMAYAQALAEAERSGIPIKSAPRQYDPAFVAMTIRKGMSIDDILNDREKARKARADGVWVMQDGKRKFVRKDELGQMSEKGDVTPMDQQLKLIGDPESPTGSSYVPEFDAIGKPGPPKSGLNVEFGPDGKVRSISTGSQGAKGGDGTKLTKTTVNEIQKRLLNGTEELARLQDIDRTFDPKFMELGTRLGIAWTAGQEKLGIDVSEADRAELDAFTDFKRNAVENANRAIKEFTGAQMNKDEVPRLMNSMPNVGQGIFDGDSPTEFMSKMRSITRSLRLAQARYAWALREGKDPLKTGVSIDGMERILRERQNEIIREARERSPDISDEALRSVVVQRLGTEFGLTFAK